MAEQKHHPDRAAAERPAAAASDGRGFVRRIECEAAQAPGGERVARVARARGVHRERDARQPDPRSA